MSTSRVVLITGATTGIGLGLAKRFHRRGDQLLVTGRSEERLDRVRAQLPGVLTFAGDLAIPADRERLAHHVTSEFPDLDVLINNAGIQRRVEIARDRAAWHERQHEIDLLLAAPIHLVSLLTPLLLAHGRDSQIVNVTSGGAFNPQPFAPTYSAAKAALHSYTMNLRYALEGTTVTVTELIPPAVATDLAGPGTAHGADVDEFCDAAFTGIDEGREEVGFGPTSSPEFLRRLTEENSRFAQGAKRFPVARYVNEATMS
ncbi:SDR family oxidoreductase [Microbispora sp. NPDC049125]|uniref:SDR family oxidoreductase n=1 Tax=Microbispora sp. NPDC049125 TaxID=3154929 RepID=UPI0034663270